MGKSEYKTEQICKTKGFDAFELYSVMLEIEN